MSVHNTLYVKNELFTNKVSGTDFTDADWALLGTVDQDLSKTDDVEFKSMTFNNTTNKTKVQTGATVDYILTLPTTAGTTGQALTTDGSGALSWNTPLTYDQSLNTTDSVQFTDLTLSGNLTVQGSTTLIDTENTVIKDNIIILNSGESGPGVTVGTAGVEINRGALSNAQFLFNEIFDRWTVGLADGSSIHLVSELADTTQTQGSIPGFDANGRLTENEGLTAGEVNQLQNIGTTTITDTQWGYLGSTDQELATTNSVEFNGATLSGDLIVNTDSNIANSVSAVITAGPITPVNRITVVNTTSGAVNANLPDASQNTGKCYTIVLQTGANQLIIGADASGTIDGEAEIILDTVGQHITLMSDGSNNWLIV